MYFMKSLITLAILLISTVAAPAQFGGGFGESHVKATLVSDHETIVAGQPFKIGLRLVMEDKWHTYWENPGSSGLPPTIKLEAQEGLTLGDWQFPIPKEFVDDAGYITFGYDDEAILIADATYTGEATSLTIKGKVDWLECKEMCIPGSAEVDLNLAIAETAKLSSLAASFDKFSKRIPKPFALDAPFSYSGQVSHSANKDGEIDQWQLDLRLTPSAGADFSAKDLGFFPLAVPEDLAGYTSHKVVDKGDYFQLTAEYESYGDAPPAEMVLSGVLVLNHVSPPISYRLPLNASVAASTPALANAGAGTEASGSFWRQLMTMDVSQLPFGVILFIAFLGGIILNIMPCVLPVLSLKVFQVVQEAGDSVSHRILHAWIYTLGILVSFLVLAAFIIINQLMGRQLGIGFQFESPAFVIFMAALIFTMALSFFGVFQILAPNSQKINTLTQKGGLQGAFFHGAFMTVLSTPCTAPGLGAIYGWMMQQNAWAILLVLQAVGFGLAFPYLVLCHSPTLMRFLPKPGAWMESVKIAMGFLLCGTVIWLVAVLNKLTGASGVTGLLTLLLGLSCASYIYGQIQFGSRRMPGFIGMAAVIVALGYLGMFNLFDIRAPFAAKEEADRFLRLSVQAELEKGGAGFFNELEAQKTTGEKIAWIPYSKESLEYFRSQNRIIFLDFTAEWCITCKANEKLFINTRKVREAFAEHEVVTIKVDYTDMSEEITAKLRSFDRAGVPLYVFYPGGDDAIVLPEAINQGMLIDAVLEAQALLAAKTAHNL
jgi:thiol:disulfide interchange protein DsbD